MITIFKYELELIQVQELELPLVEVLTVQMQGDRITIWIKADTNMVPRKVKFRIVGTGNPFPTHYTAQYIGTVQRANFVWHIFKEN